MCLYLFVGHRWVSACPWMWRPWCPRSMLCSYSSSISWPSSVCVAVISASTWQSVTPHQHQPTPTPCWPSAWPCSSSLTSSAWLPSLSLPSQLPSSSLSSPCLMPNSCWFSSTQSTRAQTLSFMSSSLAPSGEISFSWQLALACLKPGHRFTGQRVPPVSRQHGPLQRAAI